MKKINKLLSVMTAAALSVSMLAGCAAKAVGAGYDDGKMRKNMTASEYAQDMGIGINLGNTMDAYWQNIQNKTSGAATIGQDTVSNYETCWGAIPTTQEMIDGMKAEGFKTVRIPVYWGNKMADDGTFTISEDIFKRVEELIDYCRKNGLYAVINVHHYDEYIIKNYDKDKALEIFKNLWTQIASRYKDYSDYLIFEGYNENVGTVKEGVTMTDDEIYDYVNALNQTFVDAVRATGGNNKTRLLIASGYWTNIDNTTNERFRMPTDSAKDKLMVSVHYVDNAMYWTNKIGGDEWLDYSKAQCELLKKAFTDKNIPVFIGECTSIYDDERFIAGAAHTDSTECLEIMLNMMMDYGFVPVLWDGNNNFYSRTEYRIKSDSDRELIHKLTSAEQADQAA